MFKVLKYYQMCDSNKIYKSIYYYSRYQVFKMGNKYSTTTIIGGSCDQEYETVKQMFVKNFKTGIFVSNNHLKCVISKRHFIQNQSPGTPRAQKGHTEGIKKEYEEIFNTYEEL